MAGFDANLPNNLVTLEEIKIIYFWEWFRRMWCRSIDPIYYWSGHSLHVFQDHLGKLTDVLTDLRTDTIGTLGLTCLTAASGTYVSVRDCRNSDNSFDECWLEQQNGGRRHLANTVRDNCKNSDKGYDACWMQCNSSSHTGCADADTKATCPSTCERLYDREYQFDNREVVQSTNSVSGSHKCRDLGNILYVNNGLVNSSRRLGGSMIGLDIVVDPNTLKRCMPGFFTREETMLMLEAQRDWLQRQLDEKTVEIEDLKNGVALRETEETEYGDMIAELQQENTSLQRQNSEMKVKLSRLSELDYLK